MTPEAQGLRSLGFFALHSIEHQLMKVVAERNDVPTLHRGLHMRYSPSYLVMLILLTVLSARIRVLSAEDEDHASQYEKPGQAAEKEFAVEVKAFLSAKTSREAGETCLKLFPTRFDGSITELMLHDNPQIAVQAAWRRYSRMTPRRDPYFGAANETIDPRDLERFLGFVEGKAQVRVPDWWELALADPDMNLQRGDDRYERGWIEYDKLILQTDEAYVTLEISDDKVRIPVETFRWVTKDADATQLAFAKDEQKVVLMEYKGNAAQSNLVCIDLNRSKEIWRNAVWCSGGEQVPMRTGPPPRHHVNIELTDKRVFVFGATNSHFGAYVDVFALQDGSPIIRFSTKNWIVKTLDDKQDGAIIP